MNFDLPTRAKSQCQLHVVHPPPPLPWKTVPALFMLVRLPEWSFLTWGAFYQVHVSNKVKGRKRILLEGEGLLRQVPRHVQHPAGSRGITGNVPWDKTGKEREGTFR
jgi:hypothetical protein